MEIIQEKEIDNSNEPDKVLAVHPIDHDIQPPYVPLMRPQAVVSTQGTNNLNNNLLLSRTTATLEEKTSTCHIFSGKSETIDPSYTNPNSSEEHTSDDNSDYENRAEKNWSSVKSLKKKRRTPGVFQPSCVPGISGDCGEEFKKAAAAYQNALRANDGALPTSGFMREETEKCNSMNNVWGSVIREDTLTSELTSITVGRKSAKLLSSDRGSEAYEYAFGTSSRKPVKREQIKFDREVTEKELDMDLDQYWKKEPEDLVNSENMDTSKQRKNNAICGGKKRAATERSKNMNKKSKGEAKVDSIRELPTIQPGEQMIIPDLSRNFIDILIAQNATVNAEITNSLSSYNSFSVGKELAKHLNEPKAALIIGVVDLVGGQVVYELFQKTQKIEAEGGMMIKNGARRRTPGGVFLHLLREINDDPRVDPKKVKQFFAQSQRNDFHQNNKKYHHSKNHQQKDKGYNRDANRHPYRKNHPNSYQRRPHLGEEGPEKEDSFQKELEALKKLSQKVKGEREKVKSNTAESLVHGVDMENEDGNQSLEEEIKPLPDILTSISNQMTGNIAPKCNAASKRENALEKTGAIASTSTKIVAHHDLLASCQPSTSNLSGYVRSNITNPSSQLDNFEEPEAPPNSVERVDRTISTYEDDLLADFSTEDIDLF